MSAKQDETSTKVELEPLPDFEVPPINEVVCGVQFEGLGNWQTPHFGLFWERVRTDYPEFSDQQPLLVLPDPMEPSPDKVTGVLQGDLVPLRRVWLLAPKGTYLMQVDPPMFLHNWRRIEDTDPYPRFADAYSRYIASLESFLSFVKDESLGKPKPSQYELTYINHIFTDDPRGFPEALDKFIRFYSWEPSFLAAPAAANIALRVPLAGNRGMLAISARHGVRRSDEKEALVLELTARGLADPSDSDMSSWFELAHETIVRGFAEITTPHAHKVWGRKA